MNPRGSWIKKPVHWEEDGAHYFSIVFTWDLWEWSQTAQQELDGKQVFVGGPAVKLMPELVPDWVKIGKDRPALWRHNPLATRTSTGCIQRCPFCAVPEIEGDLRELDSWENKPILIDNNLLACSRRHFDQVIDKLKGLDWCDFNQGLYPPLMTRYHASRLVELKDPLIRLSLNHLRGESSFQRAYALVRHAGLPKKNIRAYVLIGYDDTPESALYRLQLVAALGIMPNPMRYQPPRAKAKNEYIGTGWTLKELDRYMAYWSNRRCYAGVPFEEFHHHGQRSQAAEVL